MIICTKLTCKIVDKLQNNSGDFLTFVDSFVTNEYNMRKLYEKFSTFLAIFKDVNIPDVTASNRMLDFDVFLKRIFIYMIKFPLLLQLPVKRTQTQMDHIYNSKKCLFVCSASTAYTSFCRSLKYLLKVRYIILIYPIVARFLIFKTHCLGRAKTLIYV